MLFRSGSACSAVRPAVGCDHWGRAEHLSCVRNALGVKEKVIAPVWWICVPHGEERLSQPSNHTCPVRGGHVVSAFVELLAEVMDRGAPPHDPCGGGGQEEWAETPGHREEAWT